MVAPSARSASTAATCWKADVEFFGYGIEIFIRMHGFPFFINELSEGSFRLGKKQKRLTIYHRKPLILFGSGGWIRTNDLRVMSPTSYQTAPPRIS